ncbi:protein NDNF-like isoform X2 [Anopheles albimanus]|nr:protein NDNF-like isoform X2 [Anopheles albimanus]
MATCSRQERSFDPPIEWWVMHEKRYVAALTSGTTFYRSCAQRGHYQVVVNVTGLPMAGTGDCSYRLSYNRKGAEEYRSWPFRNLTTPSRIKVQQQRRRFVAMIKWEKSKLDIHAMQYCLAVSTSRRQRSLCQALGNTIHQSSCDSIAINEYLKRQLLRDERKMDPNAETTLVCTGSRTKQLIRGMKPNVTYFVDVFAIHSRHNNLSFLLGTTQVQLNRTRPTQLIEGKVVIGKLSTLGGLSLFSFKVPKRSQNNFFKLHVTPCGGSVNVEILKRKQHIVDTVWDVYYPKTITVTNVRPGERYLIRVYEAEDTSRLNRIQVAVTSREEFADLPRMPQNTTITELVPLRKCQSSTIAWFRSPDKDVTYCVYVFKLSKTQYYSNVKIPTYCELESRDVCNHPQFHNKHCFNDNDYNPLSLDIPNLQPEHYYSVFVTAIPARGRSLPYKSVRIKTASFCPNQKQLRSDRGMLTTKAGFRKGLANARNTSSQAAGHNSLPDDARGGSKRRARNRRLETTIQKT